MHTISRSRLLLAASAAYMMLALALAQDTCPCSSALSICPIIADDGDGTCTVLGNPSCTVWNCDVVSVTNCELVTRSSLQFNDGDACGLVTSTVARPLKGPPPPVEPTPSPAPSSATAFSYFLPTTETTITGAMFSSCDGDVCLLTGPIALCVEEVECSRVFLFSLNDGPPTLSLSGNPLFQNFLLCTDEECTDGVLFDGGAFEAGPSFGSNDDDFNPFFWAAAPYDVSEEGRMSIKLAAGKASNEVKFAINGGSEIAGKGYKGVKFFADGGVAKPFFRLHE
mmetsp:Transcript_3509/g.9100  ORF Transcript_3509/g.9100 Transcript_3509/m.9100 type:complete len:282 (-) Transcript_3509:140-985(-)